MGPTDDYELATPPLPDHRSEPAAGRVLCFAPHPDDEAIGPGGALRLHRLQGDPVRVVVATDGTAGDPDGKFPAAGYAERRRAESRAGLAELGVADVAFWGFPDSCVVGPADLEAIAARVAAEVDGFRPDIVYLPWAGEVNSDHRALHAGVAAGLVRAGFAGAAFGYEVWTPLPADLILDITAVADDKRRAIGCYETQLAYVDYRHPIFGLNAHRALLFQRGRGYCEGFQRVR